MKKSASWLYLGIIAASVPIYFIMISHLSSLSILIINFVIGVYLVVKGSDYFVEGAASIAAHKNVSEHTIGLTLVALATSLPELAVSSIASFMGHPVTAWGNAVGSNIANIGLVLAVAAIIMPLSLSKHVKKDASVLLLVTLLLILFIFVFSSLLWWMGLVFFIIYIIYLLEIRGRKEEVEPVEIIHSWLFSWLLTIFGAAGVIWGGRIIVVSAVSIARVLGISEIVISSTVVAVGTSLPELATSVTAALKKKYGIAVGNVIGSNIFNTLIVLGAAVLISPITLTTQDFQMNLVFLFAMTFATFLLCWKKKIGKIEGLILLFIYALFLYYLP